jgi:hypothetical protein
MRATVRTPRVCVLDDRVPATRLLNREESMSDLPKPETDDPREIDAGELSRPSLRHLPPQPLKIGERKALWGFLAAAAAVVAAAIALTR